MIENHIVEKKDIQDSDHYSYTLPPQTDFGVTVLINTSNTHTITIYVDGQAQSPELTGSSQNGGSFTRNQTLSGIYHSGSGDVKVAVKVNGNPVKSSKYAHGIFEMEPGLAIFATEDGSDKDFNDSIVILNWPLG
jgi:sulfur carrier protein ThiS